MKRYILIMLSIILILTLLQLYLGGIKVVISTYIGVLIGYIAILFCYGITELIIKLIDR